MLLKGGRGKVLVPGEPQPVCAQAASPWGAPWGTSFPLLEPSPLSVPLRWPNGAEGLQLLWITDLWRGFLFFQMRWYPPSEATQQGWKSRQFC